MWVGRADESDEHLLVNEIGHVVRVRTVRRCVENENSAPDVEVQERWTPTEGCKACESAHGHKHVVRCETGGYEYHVEFTTNPREVLSGQDLSRSGSVPTVAAQTFHTSVKRVRLEGKPHVESHESSATLPSSSQPMDLSDVPERVRLNMKRSLFELNNQTSDSCWKIQMVMRS